MLINLACAGNAEASKGDIPTAKDPAHFCQGNDGSLEREEVICKTRE